MEETYVYKLADKFASMKIVKEEHQIASILADLGNGNPMVDGSQPDYNQKSENIAYYERVRGNSVLNSAPEEALTQYTKSIAFAPGKSEALSFGYANRAVVLAAMGYNFDAIADNQRAIKFDYPEKLKYKVLARLGKCYEKVGQYGRALTCLNAALEGVNSSDLKEEDKSKYRADHIQPFLDACEAAGEETGEDLLDWTEEPLIGVDRVEVPTLGDDENPELPSASSSVALKYNSFFGRHLVATKDIELGDVVIVEDPYAAVLKKEKFYDFCSHCLKRSRTLQPCSVCSWAMFCSNICKSEAEEYHKLECLYLLPATKTPEMIANTLNLFSHTFLLAMRLTTRYGLETVTKNPSEERESKNDEEKRTAGFNKHGKYDPSDINTILNLYHNRNTIKDHVSMTNYCFVIATIMKLLKFNTVVGYIEISKFLYRFIINATCNGVISLSEFNLHKGDRDPFGTGIYPTYSLMNQNCIGNTFATFHGKTIVVRASKTIKKGEQLFVVKGQNTFLYESYKKRFQNNKDVFHFTCTCIACKEKWPILEKLDSNPKFLFGGRKFSNQLRITHNKVMESCNFDEHLNVIVNSKTVDIIREYTKFLENKKLSLCVMYYNLLNCVMAYYFKHGSIVGKIDDPETPNVLERVTKHIYFNIR